MASFLMSTDDDYDHKHQQDDDGHKNCDQDTDVVILGILVNRLRGNDCGWGRKSRIIIDKVEH